MVMLPWLIAQPVDFQGRQGVTEDPRQTGLKTLLSPGSCETLDPSSMTGSPTLLLSTNQTVARHLLCQVKIQWY